MSNVLFACLCCGKPTKFKKKYCPDCETGAFVKKTLTFLAYENTLTNLQSLEKITGASRQKILEAAIQLATNHPNELKYLTDEYCRKMAEARAQRKKFKCAVACESTRSEQTLPRSSVK